MIDEIIKYTNMYKIDKKKTTHGCSRDKDCMNLSRSELFAYFGLLYLIGKKKKKIHHTMEYVLES